MSLLNSAPYTAYIEFFIYMKRTSLFFILSAVFFISILTSCVDKQKNQDFNRIYFSINPENRRVVLPVRLNDSITANLFFDTGGQFVLDSTFCITFPSLVPNSEPVIDPNFGSYWAYNRSAASVYHSDIPKVKLGKIELEEFDKITVFNWKGHFKSDDSDGMLNIPKNDTINVWEFNFENNYLEIHSENFKMPENCFVTPLLPNFYIRMPFKVSMADGDTISINQNFFVDLGLTDDIALMYKAKELNFFNRREDAVWTESSSPGGYLRYYTVNAVLFNEFLLDSLRVYTYDHRNDIASNYLVGLNFLKRFNLFFDMKNREIGLQPVKNFKRLVNPLHRRFHFSTRLTPDRKLIVDKVADYPGNYYKEAGIQEGDKIITVNDIPVEDIINKENPEHTNDTLKFDIIRKGKLMKITVPINKNEVHGD